MYKKCVFCNTDESDLIFNKDGYEIVKCRKCDLVYLGNPPSKLELKNIYSFDQGYHNTLVDVNSIDSKYQIKLSRKYHKLLTDYLTNGTILDLGCSVGYFLNIAKQSGWQAYGIELSEDTAQIGRDRFGLDIRTQDIKNVDYPLNFFDAVTLWDVIEHLENPLLSLRKISPFIKDNGYLLISTPNIDGLYPRISYSLSKIINNWRHPEPPYHLYQFSKKTLSQLLQKSGFEVIKIVDMKIRLSYTFGPFKTILKSIKKTLYSLVFVPIVVAGPLLNCGDTIIAIARKNRETVC